MGFDLRALGRATDLIFAKANGQVVDKEDYLLIQTPTNPGFYWGNYILFDKPPKKGDFHAWKDLFVKEFPYYETIKHMVFTWQDQSEGDISEFVEHGFRLSKGIVLSTQSVHRTPRYNSTVAVKPVLSDTQWHDVLEGAIRENTEHDPVSFRAFKEQQMSDYRRLQEDGKGQWYGAYLNDVLVGSCGVFYEGGLARFQQVITDKNYRNRGVCNTLVYEVSARTLDREDVHTLVMEADEEYHAAKIYEGIGFKPTEKNYALEWW